MEAGVVPVKPSISDFIGLIEEIIGETCLMSDVLLIRLAQASKSLLQSKYMANSHGEERDVLFERLLRAMQILTVRKLLGQDPKNQEKSPVEEEELLRLLIINTGQHDLVSHTSQLLLALMFKTALRSLGDSFNKQEQWEQCFLYLAQLLDPDGVIISGSSAERLFIAQNFLVTSGKELIEEGADIDVMVVSKNVRLYNEPLPEASICFVLIPSGCHPGYTRIEIVGDRSGMPGFLEVVEIDGRYFLRNQQVLSVQDAQVVELFDRIDKTTLSTQSTSGEFEATVDKSLQGPAITRQTTYVHQSGIRIGSWSDMDVVPAVYADWPRHLAGNWITRPANWPSRELREAIAATGCHVVAVAHARSTLPVVEWRMSFSRAELCLAHSLTPFQRSCYRLFKLLCQTGINPKKVIASYFLKTTFFWLCEEKPSSFWQEANIAAIILALLDRLICFLAKGTLPNLFIPMNNMVDHILPEKLGMALQSVRAIRSNPLRVLERYVTRPLIALFNKPWHIPDKPDISSTEYRERNFELRMTQVLYTPTKNAQLTQNYAEVFHNYNAQAEILELCYHCEYPHRLAFAALQSLQPGVDLPPDMLGTLQFHRYLLDQAKNTEEEAMLHYSLGLVYLYRYASGLPTGDAWWMDQWIAALLTPGDQEGVDSGEHVRAAGDCFLTAKAMADGHMPTGRQYRPLDAKFGAPTFLEMTCRLAQALLLLGKTEEAIDHLRQVLLHPESQSTWMTLSASECSLYEYNNILKTLFGINTGKVLSLHQSSCGHIALSKRFHTELVAEISCCAFSCYLLTLTTVLHDWNIHCGLKRFELDEPLEIGPILEKFADVSQSEIRTAKYQTVPAAATLYADCVEIMSLIWTDS